VRVAGDVAAGQDGHVLLGVEPLREQVVVDRRAGPQVERRLGHRARQHGRDLWLQPRELRRVLGTVRAHVRLVVPRRDAGGGDGARHRAAVIGAVEQERTDQCCVARDVAGAQPRRVRPLGQAAEHDEPREPVAAERVRGGEARQRRPRLVEVDLGVALVGCDGEAVAVGQREERAPVVEVEHAAGRIVRRADVQELRARPHVGGHRAPVVREASRGVGIHAVDPRAGQQRRTLVDLIERIGHHDGGAHPAAVDHGLAEREQCLAAAEHRQHLRCGVERRQPVPPREPAGDRLAQCGRADRRGIIRERGFGRAQRVDDQARGRMPRLADRQADRTLHGIRRHLREQRAQLLERVRLQQGEPGIHAKGSMRRTIDYSGASTARRACARR